jgi:hypothetical protein
VSRHRLSALVLAAIVGALSSTRVTQGQGTVSGPSARLLKAPGLVFPGRVDSNTPAMWSLVEGTWAMSTIMSWGGIPTLATGSSVDALSAAEPVQVLNPPGHGVWMESVVEDDGGVWYGYYHRELPADACGRPDRFIPSIGALRSEDRGRTWTDLGTVLTAPADSHACDSTNRYVIGGVGDVSVVLDHNRQDLFLYYSQYSRDTPTQGVAVARLAWADRDEPVGKLAIWSNGAWVPARPLGTEPDGVTPSWGYVPGSPLVPATRSWHDGDGRADAYWGAAIHWNTYLERWVMLVNRARNEKFDQDGFYLSYTTTLSDPRSWSAPRKLMSGGGWYPQVIGLEPNEGTDKRAGRRARFFITGRSEHFIEFTR